MHAHPAVRSATAEVRLIPWDPDSSLHIERMIEQRIACGWKAELVPSWIALQKSGDIAIQWVVIASTPDMAEKLEEHKKAHPKEASALFDTATSLIGTSRTPSNESFLPVGHIGLNTMYESPGHDEEIEGLYWISNFYISSALQGAGLGRAAMDAVEKTAVAAPLNAKVFALSTLAKENNDVKEGWVALGKEPPAITNEEWYGRRGYVPYKRVQEMWWDTDKIGKKWPVIGVFMRKYMVSAA